MMTTVCASCNTEFHVTWEKLKVRAGRVRCGKCHTVFNGMISLNRRGEDNAGAPEEIALAAQIAPVSVSAPLAPPLQPGATHVTPAYASEPSPPSPVLAPRPPVISASKDLESAPAAESRRPAATFEFGPKPRFKRSRWWLPLATLLLLALSGQTLFYFRGAIALLLPQAKPYINELCAELGCEVPLPRRAELVSIETSDLQADPANPGVMVLLATLRNRAAFPQAFPALELTLTNERDLPLARRVLQSSDYLADKTEAFDGSSEKQIRLHVEANALKASGYRLYLFYP